MLVISVADKVVPIQVLHFDSVPLRVVSPPALLRISQASGSSEVVLDSEFESDVIDEVAGDVMEGGSSDVAVGIVGFGTGLGEADID